MLADWFARRRFLLLCLLGVLWTALLPPVSITGQDVQQGEGSPTTQLEPEIAERQAADEDATDSSASSPGLNLFWLFWDSRWWMLPIVVMSFIAAAASIERALGLRRSRVMPRGLVNELARIGGNRGGFDPREAYRVCQRYPSAAASVIKAMLMKVGRPHSEVEHTAQEASQREAERLYANVRWLNLASGVCPLMGLMGTVWGMIVAFHDTTQMLPGQNKAEFLAKGIYLALVTTLGGLAVAIPATILSHYFEGRIVNLFHSVDELLFNLMPQIERYEGRVRFAGPGDEDIDTAAPSSPAPVKSP